MAVENPWKAIDLSDYENHMSLQNVYQLQTLNSMMKEQLSAGTEEMVMILGVAGGNGLEYIDRSKCSCVYGVDINRDYLDACTRRYPALGGIWQPLCADLTDAGLQLPHAGLLVAELLIEYIGYECFQGVVSMVKPERVSCIIQINTDDSFVSDSPYLHAFDRLGQVHHQMEEDGLMSAMQKIGYARSLLREQPLPNGKKFIRMDFVSASQRAE